MMGSAVRADDKWRGSVHVNTERRACVGPARADTIPIARRQVND